METLEITRLVKTWGVRTSDTVRSEIIEAHDTYGVSFRNMAKTPKFAPVPAGTLCAIYHGAEVPRKWRARFDLVELLPAPACPRCGVVHVTSRCPAQRKPRARWVRVMGHQGWMEVRG